MWYILVDIQYPSYLFYFSVGLVCILTFWPTDVNATSLISVMPKCSVSLLQDFVISLSIILRGSITDKLNWAFNLYDLNKDGCITREVLLPFPVLSYVVSSGFFFLISSLPPSPLLSRRWQTSCTPFMTWWGSIPTPVWRIVLPWITLTASSR